MKFYIKHFSSSHESSFTIVKRIRTEGPGNQISIAGRSKYFSPVHRVDTGCGVHSSSSPGALSFI
jgi:hypothetical protein